MSTESNNNQKELALIAASLLARLWLAVRAIQTGIEKFAGKVASSEEIKIDGAVNDYGLTDTATTKGYALSNYHGVPKAMMEQFEGEPLLPGFGLKIYDWILGPALLALGFAILLGVCYRASLFALGLLYVSLTWGLILLGQDPGVAWLGTHMILIVMALMLSEHNRLAILKKW